MARVRLRLLYNYAVPYVSGVRPIGHAARFILSGVEKTEPKDEITAIFNSSVRMMVLDDGNRFLVRQNPWPDDDLVQVWEGALAAAMAAWMAAVGGSQGPPLTPASADEGCADCTGAWCMWCRDGASVGCNRASLGGSAEEWRDLDSDGSGSSQLGEAALYDKLSDVDLMFNG